MSRVESSAPSRGLWDSIRGLGQRSLSQTVKPQTAPVDSMLDLFLSMLDVRTHALEGKTGQDADALAIVTEARAKIDKLRASPQADGNAPTWNEAYRLERMLCLVEPPEVLLLDLDRRLDEAAAQGLAALNRLKADVDRAKSIACDNTKAPPGLNPGGELVLRDAMNNLLEELHWEDQKKFFVTPLLKQAVRRIVGLGMITFFIVLLPYLVLYWSYVFGYPIKVQSPNNIPSISTWVWLPLFTVVTAGAFGAFFSRLLEVAWQNNRFSSRELESAGTWRNLFLRGAVGMLGAFVLFLFLKSGLVRGNMFPEFTKIGLDFLTYGGPGDGTPDAVAQSGAVPEIMHLIVPSNALALLAVWSFLAGFSERLVPNVLANTEASLAKSANVAGGQQQT